MASGDGAIYLFDAQAITTAGTTTSNVVFGTELCAYLLMEAVFTYGSGGTSANVYVQTSLDAGTTWIDIANFSFTTTTGTRISKVMAVGSLTAATTPTDGSITANTVLDGVIGNALRAKIVSVGTYASTTLTLAIRPK